MRCFFWRKIMTDKQAIAQKMLSDVEALLPKFRERTSHTKELRRVPDESVKELQEIGFFLALQPEQYGGYELDPKDFFKMQSKIAEACMSTAWACGIISVHTFQLAIMPEQAQKDVWEKDIHTRISSSYAPMGKVEVVDGGFKFSGRWGWSSGSQHCTWVLLGGIVPGEGYRTFLIPKEDYVIEDTWHVMGLQGTGSQDIVVEGCFVPEHRTHKQMDGFNLTNPGMEVNKAPLYQIPWAQLFIRTVCTSAIGAAKKALGLFIEGATGKASNDPTKLAGDTYTQEILAQVAHKIDVTEAIMYRNFDALMECVNEGKEIPLLDRVKYRYQSSLVIEDMIEAVDKLFNSAGGRSVFLDSEIQQCFMDIHIARAHVANNPTSFSRNYGSMLLGVENKDFFV